MPEIRQLLNQNFADVVSVQTDISYGRALKAFEHCDLILIEPYILQRTHRRKVRDLRDLVSVKRKPIQTSEPIERQEVRNLVVVKI